MSDIQEEQKRLYKRAEENDIKLLKERINFLIDRNDEKEDRINKAVDLLNDWDYLDKIDCYNEPKEVIDILKGDNK